MLGSQGARIRAALLLRGMIMKSWTSPTRLRNGAWSNGCWRWKCKNSGHSLVISSDKMVSPQSIFCWRWLEKVKTCRFSEVFFKWKSTNVNKSKYLLVWFFCGYHHFCHFCRVRAKAPASKSMQMEHQITTLRFITWSQFRMINPEQICILLKILDDFQIERTPRKPAISSIHPWNHKSEKMLCLQ